MPTASRTATVANPNGLHMRPAMTFVDLANQYTCTIRVSGTVDGESREADAKSLMFVIQLAATQGTVLLVEADGDDAQQAVDTLADFVDNLVEEDDEEPAEADG